MRQKTKALLAGLATWIPGYDHARTTGGTDSARYCYSVWLRHLVLAQTCRSRAGMPGIVAELGPGDTIGIGVAALLSGVEKYYALDLVRYSNSTRTRAIFDELVQLYGEKTPIPDGREFPELKPGLDCYDFPHRLLSDDAMAVALAPGRIAAVRSAIDRAASTPTMIVYQAPWDDPSIPQTGSVDFVFSQAVLEHVDDLEGAYAAMRRWLKPTGAMSHQIDFRCHRKADAWNGHWSYSDMAWKVVVGRRSYLLNRAPLSRHVSLLRKHGFHIASERLVRTPSSLRRSQLAARFRDLSEQDLTTSGAHIVAIPSPTH